MVATYAHTEVGALDAIDAAFASVDLQHDHPARVASALAQA